MAFIRPDGMIQTSRGNVVGPDDKVDAADLCELVELLCAGQIANIARASMPSRLALGIGGGGRRGASSSVAPSLVGVACTPDRVVYVQPQPWGPNCGPNYVNTIPQAIARAATLVPTEADPVAIYVYPGIYPDSFVMIPWVAIKSVTVLTAVITGNWTYTPSGAGQEVIEFENVRFEPPSVGTVDTTAKTGGQGIVLMAECVFDGSIVFAGRAMMGPADALLIRSAIDLFGGSLTVTDCFLAILGGSIGPVELHGASVGLFSAVLFIANLHAFDTSVVQTASACTFFGPVEADAGTNISAPNSAFYSTVTSNLGALIDVRGGEVLGGSGAIMGGGAVERTLQNLSVGPTVPGANPVAFTTPYANGSYNVQVTENAGAGGGAWVSVTAKAAGGFVLNDPTGGRTFDITVNKE